MAPGLYNAEQTIARIPNGDASQARELTAMNLWTQAAALSALLTESKVHTWVLASRNPWEVLVGCLAAWSVTERELHIALPPNLLPRTLDNLVTRCDHERGPAEVLAGAAIAACSAQLPTTSEAEARARHWAGHAAEQLSRKRSSQTPCLTLFTSGTTGEQQACPKRLQQLWLEAELHARAFFQPPNPEAEQLARCVLCCVPPHHIFGLLFGVWVPFAAGVSFVATNAEPSIPSLSDGVTELVSVPTQLGAWIATREPSAADGPRLKRVFCSGGPLPPSLGHELILRGLQLIELFGSTETGGIAQRIDDPGGVWCPLPSVNVSQGDDQRLLLCSSLLDTTEPVLTQDRIVLAEGGFVHLGRSDDVVKVGAKRVALGDLEHFVRSLPGVSDAAAIAVPNLGLREHALWLAVVADPRADVPATEERLRVALREHFDAVVVPRRIKVIDHLPRNAVGKLPREALLTLFETTADVPLRRSGAGESEHGV